MNPSLFLRRPALALLVSLLCLALPVSGADAATEPSVLSERGRGRLTYLFWKIYDVTLSLPASVPSTEVLKDHSRQLTFVYLRAFTAAELAKATTSTIQERQGTPPSEEITSGLTAINALWPAVQPGDRLELFYQSGNGTTVSVNGRLLGLVPGAAFSRVLFSIWLGDDPIDKGLRRQLLG